MATKGLAAKLRAANKKLHEANLERRRLALENRELREQIARMDSCWVHGCAHDGVECARAHPTTSTTSAATPARPAADPDPGAGSPPAACAGVTPSQHPTDDEAGDLP